VVAILQTRAKEKIDRLLAWTDQRPRLLLWTGLALTLWMAMAHQVHLLAMTPREVEAALAVKDDIPNLYHAAANASWSDIPKWWIGSWIYPEVGYYRPLTSMLYFFEQRAFDRNFSAYNAVTWLLHGLNAALLFLLTLSLFQHHPRARYLLALTAVYFFATPANSLYFGVTKALAWWPAQNDVMGLTFCLLSLLLLDRHLQRPRRRWPVGALLAFAASIGTKEMGFIILPIALAFIYCRKRRAAPEMAVFVVLAVALWYFRRLVVTNAWGPDMYRLVILHKGLFHWTGPVYTLVKADIWWPLAAGAAVGLLVAVGLRKRWSVYTVAFLSVLATALCAQLLSEGGGWALLLVEQEQRRLAEVLIFLLGLALFWRYRRVEPGLLACAALLLVYLPILQYGGPHYFYWPGAFLGLIDATFCVCLWRWAQALRTGANWQPPAFWRAVFSAQR